MAHPVIWWEIGGKDAEKSQAFYSKLFDWKIDTNAMEGYGLVETGGEGGIGGGIFKSPSGSPYITFYVQVDDVNADIQKAESLGAKVAFPPQEVPGVGTVAIIADPDGNMVGLFKPLAKK